MLNRICLILLNNTQKEERMKQKSEKSLRQYKEKHREDVNQFMKKHATRMNQILVTHFGMNEDIENQRNRNLFVSYFTHVRNLHNKVNPKTICFHEYLHCLLKKEGNYYLYVLAYYLLINQDELYNSFYALFKEDRRIQKHYDALNDIPFIETNLKEKVKVVSSVLLELDSCQNKVKNILYQTTELDYQKLDELNRKQYEEYLMKNVSKEVIQNMAYVFIMNYFVDKSFLACFSPYLLVIEEQGSVEEENVRLEEMIESYLTMIKESEIYQKSVSDTYSFDMSALKNIQMEKEELTKSIQLKESILKLMKIEQEIKKEKIEKETIEQYTKEIQELQEEIDETNEHINQFDIKKKELINLQEFLFSSAQKEVIEEERNLETISKEVSISFVGGHENLVKNMRQLYPGLIYVSGDSVNVDMTKIKQSDYVIFFYKHMNHNVYETIMNVIVKENISFGYVSSTNIKRITQEILNCIK